LRKKLQDFTRESERGRGGRQAWGVGASASSHVDARPCMLGRRCLLGFCTHTPTGRWVSNQSLTNHRLCLTSPPPSSPLGPARQHKGSVPQGGHQPSATVFVSFPKLNLSPSRLQYGKKFKKKDERGQSKNKNRVTNTSLTAYNIQQACTCVNKNGSYQEFMKKRTRGRQRTTALPGIFS